MGQVGAPALPLCGGQVVAPSGQQPSEVRVGAEEHHECPACGVLGDQWQIDDGVTTLDQQLAAGVGR
jgi:hypothetical protein